MWTKQNLSVFNMITGINESKTLIKHISCECKCIFDGIKCTSNQWWNNDKCQCECKKHHICEERLYLESCYMQKNIIYVKKDYIWNLATCRCENDKYLASITDDSVITCGEFIETKETKIIPKNIICETKSFYILLAFLLITITLLIAVSIYYYLIKYKTKQKHLLTFYVTNNKLKEVLYCYSDTIMRVVDIDFSDIFW